MTGRLEGKTALVTGAARGLGTAIAARFHDEGASVIINDLREDAAIATTAQFGGAAIAADVSSSTSVAAMFAQVAQYHERLDILVNNAGISGLEADPELARRRAEKVLAQAREIGGGGPIETHQDITIETSDDQWRAILSVHLDGTFYCCREALKIMSAQAQEQSSTWVPSWAQQAELGLPAIARPKPGFWGSLVLWRARSSPGTSE